MPEPTTIAITGSAGHLAAAVIPLLIAKGFHVRALVYKDEPRFPDITIESVKGSLDDKNSLDKLLRDCSVVIHGAAKISLNSNRDPSIFETNVQGTKNIFEAAKKAGVKRFIHISSIHAYEQIINGNDILNEESPYCSDKAPRYDQSKRDSQKYVLENSNGDMEVMVLNPTSVVGPFDNKPSFMGKALMDIYNRKVPMLIRGGFDFCDVRDVADGIVNAVDKGRSGESYLLAGKWYSLDDLQKIILEIKVEKKRIPVLPSWTAYLGLPFIRLIAALRRQDPLYTHESIFTLVHGNKKISSAKAAKELDYSCRPLQETIADAINWFKQAGYLS